MSGTHFYLTLPSNASLSTFPDNKTTGYRVKLPQTIDLGPGNWEVGLYSISYPHTWYALQKKDTMVFYTTGEVTAWEGTNIPYGYYETVQQVVDAIN